MSSRDHRRFYPHDVDLVSIDSSNQTQSDLPGLGRNLGNLYSFLGKHLEGFFNGLAERRGHGPNAVAVRIRKRDERRRGRRYGLAEYTEKEVTEQKKDLEKLIKYSKSRIESTRQQALENITDFAWHKNHLRDLLKALNAAGVIRAQEPYIWDYCDPSVQISSRLALACVQEDRIFHLAQSLSLYSSYAVERSSLAEYMRLNPEQSFLVLRLFTRYMEGLALDDILTEVEALAVTSPEQVEWEEVDKLFEYWFADCFCSRINRKTSFRPFWRICQSPEKLPRTIQSKHFRSWIRGLEDPEDIIPHALLERLLRASAAERTSQDRAFNFLSPFTQALNEADVVLCGMTASSISEDFYPANTTMCTDTINDGCAKLAKLIDSGDRWLAQRALVCCSVVLAMGIYPRSQMLKSLACTAFASSAEYVRLIDATGGKCRLRPSDEDQACTHLMRHCDDQGHLTHIWDWSDDYCCTDARSYEHELCLDLRGFMDIEIKRGEPVTAPTDVVPILAGHYSDGRRALLCRRGHYLSYCAVPEGTKAEINFTLCTLRYALDTYSRPHVHSMFAASEDQGSDATGPYSWKFVRYITRAEDGDREKSWILRHSNVFF